VSGCGIKRLSSSELQSDSAPEPCVDRAKEQPPDAGARVGVAVGDAAGREVDPVAAHDERAGRQLNVAAQCLGVDVNVI
jgi:hypothetical protein